MTVQKSFFPSPLELDQQNHPEKYAPKQGRSRSPGEPRKRSSGSARSRSESAPAVYDCNTCGLCSHCRTPQIQRFGKGEKRILFVGLCPGKDEDRIGIPFVGPSGELLCRMCSYVDVDLDKDCTRTNVNKCFSEKDPSPVQVQCCREKLLKDIEECKPELIICLGDIAINSILEKPKSIKRMSKFSAGMMHGLVVYSRKFNCWVASSYHPAFYLRRKNREDVPDDENLLAFDIARAVSYLGKKPLEPLTEVGNVLLSTSEEAIRVIRGMSSSIDPVAYDYETFRLTPWEPDAQLLSFSFTNSVDIGYFVPVGLNNPQTNQPYFTPSERDSIFEEWKKFLNSKAPKVVQNLNMEEIWNREYLHQPMSNFIHDTMLAQHILHCAFYTTSLAFQVFELTGHDYKEMVNTKDLRKEDPLKIFHYNCWDSRYTLMSYQRQIPRIKREGRLSEFNSLLQRGEMILVEMRRRGVLIDVEMLSKIEKTYAAERDKRVALMSASPGVVQYVHEHEGEKAFKGFNPESTSQLGKILYDTYQVPVYKKTKTKKGKADVAALEDIKKKTTNVHVTELIDNLFRFRKCGTLLKRAANYRRVIDPRFLVHPIFNLHTADTFRSSADSPNIQNVFKHDKELKKFRRIIIPSPGNILLEADYAALEVRVIAMASKDAELTRQIIQGVDTHRRWSSEIYRKPEKEISKDERYEGKNGFVFASFYGALPESIARRFPSCPDGHIAYVQDKFWNEFYGVRTWQRYTIEQYRSCGYVEGMSGFRRYGPLTINKLYNTPIQGPAFHLMLDSLIRIEEEFARAGLRSRLIFEVHDSVTIDTVPCEAEEVVKIVTDIMTMVRFDWQGAVPLAVEWEVSGYKDKNNWYDLQELSMRGCPACGVPRPHSKEKEKKDDHVETKYQCVVCGELVTEVSAK